MKQVILILAVILLLSGCTKDEGRYQLITQGALVLKLDRQTGQTWRYDKPSYGEPYQWIPVKEQQ
jgi:hypothetical protein